MISNDLLVFGVASFKGIIFLPNFCIKADEINNNRLQTKDYGFGCVYSFAGEIPTLRVAS